jgi:predicted nucleotidyltransferase
VTSAYALDAARDYAARLRARFGTRVAWVRLYGSRARGDATEASDVDIMAVVHELTRREKIEAIEMGFDVSLERTLHLSPVVMAGDDFERLLALESPFAHDVLREGLTA